MPGLSLPPSLSLSGMPGRSLPLSLSLTSIRIAQAGASPRPATQERCENYQLSARRSSITRARVRSAEEKAAFPHFLTPATKALEPLRVSPHPFGSNPIGSVPPSARASGPRPSAGHCAAGRHLWRAMTWRAICWSRSSLRTSRMMKMRSKRERIVLWKSMFSCAAGAARASGRMGGGEAEHRPRVEERRRERTRRHGNTGPGQRAMWGEEGGKARAADEGEGSAVRRCRF